MTTAASPVTIKDIELSAKNLDIQQAAAIYKEHGCLVVRGLQKPYIDQVGREINLAIDDAMKLYDQAKRIPEGWSTADGTLWLPAPKGYSRERQIMVLGFRYLTSGAFFMSALDKTTIDLMEAVLGPNIELFMNGQCLVKEPVGGHPKHLHQDASYFEHKFEGPCATLNYVVPTDINNGALHVVPGSHKLGLLQHVDTFSHLGLDPKTWTWDKALPICGEPGDSIFFHVKCIHGSKENFSDKPRPVYIHRYRAADDYIVIGATSTTNRADAEKMAAAAKKENQLGFMVRGFRTYQSDR